MRSSIFFTLFTFSLLCVVKSAPLPLGIGTVYGQDDLRNETIVNAPGTHNPEHMATIQNAVNTAHTQIMNMKQMLDTNHPDLHAHLTNAFGANYNKAEIHRIVNTMAAGTIDIGQTNVPNTGDHAHAVATTFGNSKTSRTMFTAAFHAMTPEAQAGTVVHEASHALGITKDYFAQDPNSPHTQPLSSLQGKGAPPGSNVKSGYLGHDYEHLKHTASDVMHKNADSYKVFAHTATHGLGTPVPPKFKPACAPGAKKPQAGCALL